MGAGASGFGGRDPWGVRDEPEEFEGLDNQDIAQQQKTIIQGSVLDLEGYLQCHCCNHINTFRDYQRKPDVTPEQILNQANLAWMNSKIRNVQIYFLLYFFSVEQDKGLDSLSKVISRQKQMAIDIGNEVDGQNGEC